MKGIISTGCSLSKGWGLWFYNLNMDKDASTMAKLKYGSHLRYTDLVSNHFNTFYIMDDLLEHSGSDWQSINFVNYILNGGEYENTDFSTLLFQLSWPTRNYLSYNDIKLGPYRDDIDPTKLQKEGLTPIQYYDLLRKQILDEVEDIFKKCESFGINPILINGSSEYEDIMNDYLKEKLLHIKVNVNQTENFSIDYLLTHGYNGIDMTIRTPQGNDSHPSSEFHQHIASSIISRIEPPLNV